VNPLTRFGRFGAVSALGMGLQLTVLWALVGAVGTLDYLPATLVAVSAAIVHNFLWHRRWTWRDRRTAGWTSAFARFVLSNGLVSLVGNAVAMAALVGGLGMHPLSASLGAVAACGCVNFALADRLVFRQSRPRGAGLR
jgi:putative flippase GtrA